MDISSGFEIFADALNAEMTGVEIRAKGPLGLDLAHYRALEIVVRGGARRRVDVATAMQSPNVDPLFARLVALGLVTVDVRSVVPTPRGHALICSTRPIMQTRQNRTQTGGRAMKRGIERILATLEKW